jgi:hypothetical protein
VLVVAEPGMGKSSTTTQVARHTKERDPTSWVVRINWNDHTGKLQKIDAAIFNFDSLFEFLCSAAFPGSKDTHINRSLLKQALQSSGNVTVLTDGFDEISPTHADKAVVILSELLKTKVGRVWVTSRPVEKERLEEKLFVIAYVMKKLSRKCQEDMLRTFWISEACGKETILLGFIGHILYKLNKSFNTEDVTGSPLYIVIIATVYEQDMKKHINLEDWVEPSLDLRNLYERFVERKLDIYLTEKQEADVTKPIVLHNHKRLKEILLEDFEKCALVAILPPHMLESLHSKTIQEEIQPFLERVQAGEDNTGVVMNVVEGKPQFVHRTLAEYFTASWFSKNFKSNRGVLKHILFDPKYEFVRNVFNRMLAKDCPLHCAVLDGDVKFFEALLKEGCDINAVDKGERSVMHIVATHHSVFRGITNALSHCEVPLENTDSVLQWTPLQYSVNSGNCCIVDWLLQSNVDTSGLDMIKQRAHDQTFMGQIIIQAAIEGHLLLLEVFGSIGVNIHQAIFEPFPSPLHAAIHGTGPEVVQIIRLLIKHGADCNTPYTDGYTPLFHAVTEGSLDVVRVLVEEGDASLDVRDKCGRTATDFANEHIRMGPLKYPNTYLEKGQAWKEIGTYLHERGCKASSTVR